MSTIISRTLVIFVFSSSVLASNPQAGAGMVSVASPYTVTETANRFEKILTKKGLTIFARINHSKNAASVKLELPPSEVVIFGNPKVGTPLMLCSKTIAVDLPQKALFWQDEKDQVWLSYNNPEYLRERHAIKGCEKVLKKISAVLGKLSKAATAK